MKCRASGILLIVGGAIGVLLWLPVALLVALLTMNPYPGAQDDAALGFALLPLLGAFGGVLGIVAGILELRRRTGADRAALTLAILTAVFSLPGTALLMLLQWAPVYAFTALIGLAPPVFYFVQLWRQRAKAE